MRPGSKDVGRRVYRRPLTSLPASFLDRLETVFGGDFRLRWSLREGVWHVEQKAPLGFARLMHAAAHYQDEWHDEKVRMRDGYTLCMRVTDQPFLICPSCELPIKVSELETTKATCENCRTRHGIAVRTPSCGWWPKNDRLIDHISSLAPGKRGHAGHEADNENARKQYREERYHSLERQAGFKDAFIDQLANSNRPS